MTDFEIVRALKRKIRVKKQDSAFVYFVLESHEGVTAYSTLEHTVGDPNRDLELMFSPDFEAEVDELLRSLGGLVSVLFD